MNEIDILIETHAHLLTILDEPHPESGTNVTPQKEVPRSFSKEGRSLLPIGPGAPRPPWVLLSRSSLQFWRPPHAAVLEMGAGGLLVIVSAGQYLLTPQDPTCLNIRNKRLHHP